MAKESTQMLAAALMLYTLFCCAEAKAKDYVSPNGRYTVHVVLPEGENPVFSIKDNRSSKVDDTIELTLPLLALRWGADSTTFMSVEHVAGGTLERVVCHRRGTWIYHAIETPSKGITKCSIVQAEIEHQTIHMTVKCTLGNGLGKCRFDFDSATGKCSNVVTNPITEEQFSGMKTLGMDRR